MLPFTPPKIVITLTHLGMPGLTVTINIKARQTCFTVLSAPVWIEASRLENARLNLGSSNQYDLRHERMIV
jgi:hypothetical protein